LATFFIEQFGCRATQADAAAIERQLVERGYEVSSDARRADVVVVNTCTVTAAADVVGNSHKPEIPRLVEQLGSSVHAASERTSRQFAREGFVPLSAFRDETPLPVVSRARAEILTGDIRKQTEFLMAPVEGGEAGHTRPVLKIQDGCDRRCSYCVIPQVRGKSRSLAPRVVIEEIRGLSARGAREVVLSGIDLGNYGRDLAPRAELAELLQRILDETSVERLRVSSVEPMDVTEDLIAIFEANERMARHFHMPLQSGSDRILRAMHRWYRAEHYARRAELVREHLPYAAIGADVIAGFPGETEDDHQATLALIERLPLTYLHVFSFSARPGTPAAELPDQNSEAVIDRRAGELRALGERKKLAFQASQVGSETRALTLNRSGSDSDGPWTRALTSNYGNLRIRGAYRPNQFLDVRVVGERDGHLLGVLV
jgi:threonylcarbamoyladenosine tRNA methylthiotransferase MtaB